MNRKAAAARYCTFIRQSNALHAEYLDPPGEIGKYEQFTIWQLSYLLHFFDDLHAQAGYDEAIDFTLSDLAGVGISKRDRDLERVAPAITRLLPVRALDVVATAAELNARILAINIDIYHCLLDGEVLLNPMTEYEYSVACRKASSLDECVELVHLITALGRSLRKLVKIPMIGMTLRAMRAPAHAAGFAALQDFLETGYRTFKGIPDIDHFLGEIEVRMIDVFERIYTLPLEQLRRDSNFSH